MTTLRIRTSEQDGQRFYRFDDPTCDLSGVIAIDSLALGPATGGCRFWRYDDEDSMLGDARRLARGMSYKNAMAGLPLGGGKAVIRRPHGLFDREAIFRSFGLVLNKLNGDYLSAEDVGTTPSDMEVVRSVTPFVFGLPSRGTAAGGDPSPWTALGVFLSIERVLVRRGIALAGSRVAVQGLGSVGADLCRRLHQSGAKLVVADVDQQAIKRLLTGVPAEVSDPNAIHASRVDIFAPCALGGGLNQETIPEIQAPVVVGAANNQLAGDADNERLRSRGILYAPDYVVNAGGIINVAAEYLGHDQGQVLDGVRRIPDRLAAVLDRAEAAGRSPSHVADAMALELIETSTNAPGNRMSA
ncbi:Glu/Leu/Phe/Val dehydrogenase dimerization domain-containing protein [Bosea sp. 124]|uniref:Leu/Phe/Val dehydrogenase n=1 Tax=Bosea sp. 124 TaxID=2135642 RepID=UPI000D40257D|nr:Glu/Leu/Phe/Val dehydrogenase dimerization domain-containing protein [Bosea sp. 124]PTM39288.1 glutamate dehydrogenase/leucine dehydrogenase [Bosea sp. 124]